MVKIFFILFLTFFLVSCSKDKPDESLASKDTSLIVYQEALDSMMEGDLVYASKKFSEVELTLSDITIASKAALLSAYCLYAVSFYTEAEESINHYINKYSADKNIPYAYYLSAVMSFEQILEEDKDIEPLILAEKKIIKFIDRYPNLDYTLDLKFKLGVVRNQLAAKELYISKYYIKTKKWIPAINRLQSIVKNYDDTAYIEEALHRLVEIYYNIGLLEEAKAAASLLGYNYNSSEWYKKSYKILNKDYKTYDKKKEKKKKDGLIKKTIKKIIG